MDVHVGKSFEYVDFDGNTQTKEFGPTLIESERQELWKLEKEGFEKNGLTYDDWVERKGHMFDDEYEELGFFGVTLHPEYDEKGGGYGKSTSGNHEVHVNIDATDLKKVRIQAHESYGHAYFESLGKPSGHGAFVKTHPDYNHELEDQIKKSTSEAESNFKTREKK